MYDIELKAIEGSYFRLCDATLPLAKINKQNKEFPAIQLVLVELLLVFLLKIQENVCKMATQKIDKTKILMTNGSLMKVESVAECSPWSILHYF